MTPQLDDRHRLALGPGGTAAWDRRLAALPPGDDRTTVLVGQLCGVDDLDAAVAQLADGLPAGGRVVFVEHVGRPGLLGRVESVWGEAVAHFPWGCHVGRDVVVAFRRNRFVVTDVERFTVPTLVPVLRSWVSGVAVLRERR